MGQFKDLTGMRFSKLTVVELAPRTNKYEIKWRCKCDCGNIKDISGHSIRRGNAKSCGCGMKTTLFRSTHNLSHTKEYNCWQAMKRRCKTYPTYIKKNITVCEEWKHNFVQFLNDMGKCPIDKNSVEREDNDGDYCKGNCTWATTDEQNNNYSLNRMVEFNGERLNVTQWAKKLGIRRHLIYQRLNKGWSIEKTFTTNKPLLVHNT